MLTIDANHHQALRVEGNYAADILCCRRCSVVRPLWQLLTSLVL